MKWSKSSRGLTRVRSLYLNCRTDAKDERRGRGCCCFNLKSVPVRCAPAAVLTLTKANRAVTAQEVTELLNRLIRDAKDERRGRGCCCFNLKSVPERCAPAAVLTLDQGQQGSDSARSDRAAEPINKGCKGRRRGRGCCCFNLKSVPVRCAPAAVLTLTKANRAVTAQEVTKLLNRLIRDAKDEDAGEDEDEEEKKTRGKAQSNGGRDLELCHKATRPSGDHPSSSGKNSQADEGQENHQAPPHNLKASRFRLPKPKWLTLSSRRNELPAAKCSAPES